MVKAQLPSSDERRRNQVWVMVVGLALVGVVIGTVVGWQMTNQQSPAPPARQPVQPAATLARPAAEQDPVVFATGPDRPTRTPDLLPATASKIVCFYDFPQLLAPTPLVVYWWVNGKELGEVRAASQQQAEAAHLAGQLILEPPAEQETFPEGIYEVELRADGKAMARASFVVAVDADKILGEERMKVGEIKVISCVTAGGVDAKGHPMQTADTFAGSDRILVVFTYINGTAEAHFVVSWFRDDTMIEQAAQRVAMADGAGRASAWIEADEALPPGQYRAVVGLAGKEQPLAEAQFIIRP